MSDNRISLDAALCQGHGVCENEAPTYFELPKRPPVVVLRDVVDPGDVAAVTAAVRYCPTHALRIVAPDFDSSDNTTDEGA